jgi:hypothetical protein
MVPIQWTPKIQPNGWYCLNSFCFI